MSVFNTLFGIIGWVCRLFTGKSDAEKLGALEVRLETLQKAVEVREAMRKAKKPVTDSALEEILRSGKLAFLLAFLLSACATTPAVITCPDLRVWTPKEQERMADELLLLPENSVLKSVMKDYAYMRSQTRECRSF